jgi:hypothetical protein
MRRASSFILIAALSLTGLPSVAQEYPANTIWGVAPSSVAASAANAVLQDPSGLVVATVPVVAGKFAFNGVASGNYVVLLQDATGRTLATSQPVALVTEAAAQAFFGTDRVAAAVVPAAAAGGIGTTGWILIGAAAVGITTAIVIATQDDEGVASPSN